MLEKISTTERLPNEHNNLGIAFTHSSNTRLGNNSVRGVIKLYEQYYEKLNSVVDPVQFAYKSLETTTTGLLLAN